jgi:aldehyde dehydrogenase (NAD+)
MNKPVPAAELRTAYDQLFIDGRWAPPAAGATEPVINPATEAPFGRAAAGGAQDCERAIAAARRAFDDGPWPQTHRDERADRLQKVLDRLVARREEILETIVREVGFTRREAPFQLEMAFTHFRRYLELARRDPMTSLPTRVFPQPDGSKVLGTAVKVREPIGVVSAITPYNAGFLLGVTKAIPALAAGNTVILKPSPYTPLTSFLLAEAIAEADLPAGVFNLVTGGVEVGQQLASDPRIDMVSFTGSDAVGAQIAAQAAQTLKKAHLELGGKSALIVRHDADLDVALRGGLFGFAFQAGQGCSMTTRMLVDNRIRPAFVERLVAATSAIKVGDPAEPDTGMGPVIREASRARVEKYVGLGLEHGARLVCGGRRPPGLAKGFFHEPTIFDDVDNASPLAQDEIFGPVAAVIGFDDDEEAIRLANASRYGLGGAIVTRNTGLAMEMALKIRTGMVSINGGAGGFHPDMPFGGYKRSGLGREWGEEGYNEYTEIKSIGFHAG